MPEIRPIKPVPLADKWVHTLMYAFLSMVFLCEEMRAKEKSRKAYRLIGGFLVPVVLGGVLELMQTYLTTCRSGDWMDFYANSIGVLIAWILITFYDWVKKNYS